MIELLARRLKINYIIDPNVKGNVSIYTYGEVKPVNYMPLLETILRDLDKERVMADINAWIAARLPGSGGSATQSA